MKRQLLVWVGISSGVLALLAVSLLLPPVQRWVLLALVPSGVELDVGAVRIGLYSTRFTELDVRVGVLDISVPEARFRYDPLELVAGRGALVLERASVEGFQLDLRKALLDLGVTDQAPDGELEGLARVMRLPLRLVVDELRTSGVVLLPSGQGGHPIRADVDVRGGGIAPGSSGELSVDVVVHLDGPEPKELFRIEGLATARQSEGALLDRITLDGRVLPTEVVLPPGLGVGARIELELSPTVERYALELDAIRPDGDLAVGSLFGRFDTVSKHLEGEWKADVDRRLVAPFFPEMNLPNFLLHSNGNLRAAGGVLRLEPELDVTGVDLLDVHSMLGGIQRKRYVGEALLEIEGGAVTVDRLQFRGVDVSGKTRFEVSTEQALTVDVTTGEITPQSWDDASARLVLMRYPLAWVRREETPTTTEGGIDGELSFRIDRGGDISVSTSETLVGNAIRVTSPLDGTVGSVDMTMAPRGVLTEERIQADLRTADDTTPRRLGHRVPGQCGEALRRAAHDSARWRARLSLASGSRRGSPSSTGSVSTAVSLSIRRNAQLLVNEGVFELWETGGMRVMTGRLKGVSPAADLPDHDALSTSPRSSRKRWCGTSRAFRWTGPMRSLLDLDIDSGRLYGELKVEEWSSDVLVAEAVEPFKIRDLAIGWHGTPLVDGLDLEARPRVRMTEGFVRRDAPRCPISRAERGSGGRPDSAVARRRSIRHGSTHPRSSSWLCLARWRSSGRTGTMTASHQVSYHVRERAS